MGLDSRQACINFCFGYSVFLEAHLQAIINSLECWQNIQTCRQASDDTTLGKSSGSRPNSEQGEGGRERGGGAQCVPERAGQAACLPSFLSAPHRPCSPWEGSLASEPPDLFHSLGPNTPREANDPRKCLLGFHLTVESSHHWTAGRE